jgi:hypothetical protein
MIINLLATWIPALGIGFLPGTARRRSHGKIVLRVA